MSIIIDRKTLVKDISIEEERKLTLIEVQKPVFKANRTSISIFKENETYEDNSFYRFDEA